MDQSGARTNATPPHMLGHVLRPDEFMARTHYAAATPAPALRPWVERYWSVRWDLAADERFCPATLDDPAVDLTFERGGIARAGVDGAGDWITGPITQGHFNVTLSGRGHVLGVKFVVGGPLAFTTADLAALRDRTVRASSWFATTPSSPGLDAPAAADALDGWLSSLRPRSPAGYDRFRSAYAALADPAVTSLAALAERVDRSERTLQREFRRFAGVGPKRLLLRARVMDAVAAIDRGQAGTLADLAAALGWFDQSHFNRDFRSIIGESPAGYASRRR